MSSDLRQHIIDRLRVRGAVLLGCHRRNNWEDESSYRMLRGNAILKMAGQSYMVQTPAGAMDFYVETETDSLLQFRAGSEWRQYWMDDAAIIWAFVHSQLGLSNIIKFIVEHKGNIKIVERMVPNVPDEEVISRVLKLYNSNGRLAKNTQRAYHVCRYCPFKARCDALDISRGDTDDWGANYGKS